MPEWSYCVEEAAEGGEGEEKPEPDYVNMIFYLPGRTSPPCHTQLWPLSFAMTSVPLSLSSRLESS